MRSKPELVVCLLDVVRKDERGHPPAKAAGRHYATHMPARNADLVRLPPSQENVQIHPELAQPAEQAALVHLSSEAGSGKQTALRRADAHH